jgi:hypothetical protein
MCTPLLPSCRLTPGSLPAGMSSPVRFSSVARSPGSTVRLAIAPDADDPMLIPSLNQVKELQDSLPRARILYLSATAASEPEQFLNYGERLRLWVRARARSLSLLPSFAPRVGTSALPPVPTHLSFPPRSLLNIAIKTNIYKPVDRLSEGNEQERARVRPCVHERDSFTTL